MKCAKVESYNKQRGMSQPISKEGSDEDEDKEEERWGGTELLIVWGF
jgi:hypothetical protein